MYRGAHGREVILKRLGRQSPLGLSKLGSMLGSIGRVFGLSIAARIDNFKVCRCNQESSYLGRGVSKGKRYRETGLMNEHSGSRAQNAGSSTRLVSIYTRKYCVKPTPKFPEFDRAKSPLFPEFAPRTTHPSLPKIQRRSQFPVLLPKEVRLLVPPSVQTNCHRSPKVQARRSKADVSGSGIPPADLYLSRGLLFLVAGFCHP